MEPPKEAPNQSMTLGLKRKPREFGSTGAFKMARTNGEHQMSICSCHHGSDHCCSRLSAVARNRLNFLRSMTPRRIMFYSGGDWSDFPESVTSLLVKAFLDKRFAVEISINETSYLFDFLSMVLINLENEGQRSVSWVDESEKCFFPSVFFDEDCSPIGHWNNQSTTNMDPRTPVIATDNTGVKDQNKPISAPLKASGCNGCCEAVVVKTEVIEETILENKASPISVEQATSIHTLCPELLKLERDSRDFVAVMRTFLSGLCNFADPASVMGIYRYYPRFSSALSCQKTFEQQIINTRYHRGDANVRYGWFGASREGVLQILFHGFGTGTNVAERAAYGTGVYLMPENRSFASVKYCDVDENGAQCMVLCRVIMGNMEKVPEGSKQCSPSSPEFDSGVDDLLKPTCYVVWGARMSSHIHPEFIVCFKMSPTVREYVAGVKDVKVNSNLVAGNQEDVPNNFHASRPRSSWISFTLLFAEIKDKVSPLAMELLNLHHRELKNKTITHDEFVKKMRLIVGDPVLISTLKMLQQNASRPSSPWMSFTLLFAEIKDKVSPLAMEQLNLHHREFKNKMITRDELVKKMRLIAGDPLLISTLKMLQQNPCQHVNDDLGDEEAGTKFRVIT